MHKLYAAANLPEAYLLQELLAKAGIDTRILNEYASGGLGELPFTQVYPEVWLTEAADLPSARRIIKHYEQRADSHLERRCPHCGEPNPYRFETCWQCGETLNGEVD